MERSRFLPELPGLPELPVITDAGTSGLRLQGTLAKALPGMTEAGSMMNIRQMEAEEYANEIRAAFAISKEYDKRSKAITQTCLLYTSPSPRDRTRSRMPSSA